MGLLVIAVAISALPHGCDLLWGNAPMMLYGKLIDQMGNPVPDAPLTFTASAESRIQVPVLFYHGNQHEWLAHSTTAKDGKFVVDAGWGRILFPGKTGDLGALDAVVPGPFYYGRSPPAPAYRADPLHPVIFMSWNDRFKRIISRSVVGRVNNDWQTLSYRLGRISPDGSGDENLQVRVIRPAGSPRAPYDWNVDIATPFPDSIAPSDGPLRSEAPATGYVQKLSFIMSEKDAHWSSKMTRHFYTASDNKGVYAGVEMNVQLDGTGADSTVTLHYTANFGRSRDLVPGPIIPVNQ